MQSLGTGTKDNNYSRDDIKTLKTLVPYLWPKNAMEMRVRVIIALFLLAWGIHHKKQNLATLYLITVALKSGVYFFYFHPRFEMDGVLTRSEFFIFFAPYAIGLLMEIVVLTRRYS